MGLVSRMFGSDKVVDTLTEGADALVFTDEEKKDFLLKYHQATSFANLARRYIALMFSFSFLFMLFLAVATWPFSQEYAKYITGTVVDFLFEPVAIILAFYYIKHIATNARKGD